ncbi:uncharacterized protein [Ptychodera flava]|uniref:uncharacterized protein n=1 Tax=Ptychodera flava TaxID=63121 RepID=UPI00396A3660
MRATYLWQAGAAVTRCCRQQHIKTFTMSCTNASASYRSSATFVDYVAPSWANRLKCIPKQRVQLAMYNTPIHAWNIPGVPSDFQLSVKRDDLSGSTLSGNKVRKLEFLMADAANQQCTSVITAGGIQSNFARSTAVAARQVGMDCHLFLRSEISEPESIGCEGNLLLDRMVGAHIYLIPKKAQYERDIKVKMEKLAAKIEEDGGKAYCVPVGGSNVVGLFGYLEGFNELIQQNVLEDFDDLVFTTGSGGTAAGLAIGNYLTGSKLKCHAIAVCDDANYFHAHINKTLQEVGLGSETKSEDILDILEGAKGKVTECQRMKN